MKIHTVVVSYQRLHLLQETVRSYLQTVTLPFTLQIVDNGSDEEVREWIIKGADAGHWQALLLNENRYPGYAANRGFESAPSDADFLHRSDNDMRYLPGWCVNVMREFRSPSIGLVGLRTSSEERYTSLNTGGTAVIRRALWEKGLRYNEQPWQNAHTEDWEICQDVLKMSAHWGRVRRPSVVHLGSGDMQDPYYQHSFGVRGIA